MDDEEVSSEDISQHYADIVKVRRSVTFPQECFGIWIKIFLRGRSCFFLYFYARVCSVAFEKNSSILLGNLLLNIRPRKKGF